MAEKRDNFRHRKRLPVRFGVEAPSLPGFTEDISDEGIFIKSGLVQGPGRNLIVELRLESQELVRLTAKVQWAKKVPPALLRTCKGGMGVRIVSFLEGEASYRALCDELRRVRLDRSSAAERVQIG